MSTKKDQFIKASELPPGRAIWNKNHESLTSKLLRMKPGDALEIERRTFNNSVPSIASAFDPVRRFRRRYVGDKCYIVCEAKETP